MKSATRLKLAHARSGDKGDTANVGLIALRDEFYPILVREVTAERVKATLQRNLQRRSRDGLSCRISARSIFCCMKVSAAAARFR